MPYVPILNPDLRIARVCEGPEFNGKYVVGFTAHSMQDSISFRMLASEDGELPPYHFEVHFLDLEVAEAKLLVEVLSEAISEIETRTSGTN